MANQSKSMTCCRGERLSKSIGFDGNAYKKKIWHEIRISSFYVQLYKSILVRVDIWWIVTISREKTSRVGSWDLVLVYAKRNFYLLADTQGQYRAVNTYLFEIKDKCMSSVQDFHKKELNWRLFGLPN